MNNDEEVLIDNMQKMLLKFSELISFEPEIHLDSELLKKLSYCVEQCEDDVIYDSFASKQVVIWYSLDEEERKRILINKNRCFIHMVEHLDITQLESFFALNDFNAFINDLILQSISSYKNCKYDLATVGFITVIDYVISYYSNDFSKEKPTKKFKRIEYKNNSHSIHYNALSKTLKMVLDKVFFGKANFANSNDEPFNVNRHWILHGRKTKAISKNQCEIVMTLLVGLLLFSTSMEYDA